MCLKNERPITRKSGFGYAVRTETGQTLVTPYNGSETPMNKWLKASCVIASYTTSTLGTSHRQISLSQASSYQLSQVGFHFFTNKKYAIRFLKGLNYSAEHPLYILVKLKYRKGKYSGVVGSVSPAVLNGIPCSTAMEIKILEVLND